MSARLRVSLLVVLSVTIACACNVGRNNASVALIEITLSQRISTIRRTTGRWPTTHQDLFGSGQLSIIGEDNEFIDPDVVSDFRLLKSDNEEANYSMNVYGEQTFLGVRL